MSAHYRYLMLGALAILNFSSCKRRRAGSHALDTTSETAAQLINLTNIAQTDPDGVATACEQKQLFVFVGDAESLGNVYVAPGFDSWFQTTLVPWQKAEWKRQWSYWQTVRNQLHRFVHALSVPDPACRAMASRMARDGRYGSITVLAMVDGPNILDANGTPNPNGDSVIQSWHFGFTPGATLGWKAYGPNYWTINGTELSLVGPQAGETPAALLASNSAFWSRAKGPNVKEVLVPRDTDILIEKADALRDLYFAKGQPFSQRHYLFKGHGAVVEKSQPMLAGGSTPDYLVSKDLDDSKDSVTLFDSFYIKSGPLPEWDTERTGYFSPIISAQTSCSIKAFLEGLDPNGAVASPEINACIARSAANAGRVGYSTEHVEGKTLPTWAKVEGPIGNDQAGSGNDNDQAGSGNDNDQGGSGNDNDQGGSGNDNDQAGSGNDNDQGGSGNDNDQGVDGLGLGSGLWGDGTQGGKGFVMADSSWAISQGELSPQITQLPYFTAGLSKESVTTLDSRQALSPVTGVSRLAVRDGEMIPVESLDNTAPQAFRFMGYAKVLSRTADPQWAFKFLKGTEQPGIVLFDTCHANFLQPSPANEAHSHLGGMKFIPTSQGGDNIGALIMSNELPLRIEAIDYGWLNAFQYSYYAIDEMRESGTPKTKAAWETFQGPQTPPAGDTEFYKRRLLQWQVVCSGSDCNLGVSGADVAGWDKIFIALGTLEEASRKPPFPRGLTAGWESYRELLKTAGFLRQVGSLTRDESLPEAAWNIIASNLYVIESYELDLNDVRLANPKEERTRATWYAWLRRLTNSYFHNILARLRRDGYGLDLAPVVYAREVPLLAWTQALACWEVPSACAIDNLNAKALLQQGLALQAEIRTAKAAGKIPDDSAAYLADLESGLPSDATTQAITAALQSNDTAAVINSLNEEMRSKIAALCSKPGACP